MNPVDPTSVAVGPLPPPGVPKVTGKGGVTFVGTRIGDPGASGGSGDPPHPPRYTVTSASSRKLPGSGVDHQLVQLRVRVRNESTFLLRAVRVAVAPFGSAGEIGVFDLTLDKPLRHGRSGWVEAQVEALGVKPPTVWAWLPPL